MRLLYRDCYGVDVSEYAVGESEKRVRPYLHIINDSEDLFKLPFGNGFNHVIAKDVFEHISKEELNIVVSCLRKISQNLFVVVPLGDGEKYYEPAYEFDKTHVIKEDVDWWSDLFKKSGFSIEDVRYKISGIKDNWKCEKGNGMFILK
jgi:hypothetical protein